MNLSVVFLLNNAVTLNETMKTTLTTSHILMNLGRFEHSFGTAPAHVFMKTELSFGNV